MTRPIDVPTRATAAFVAAYLDDGALLEVGCGDGYLARELERLGLRVQAIDADPDSVTRARERGVSATLATWPQYESDPWDAIAFTRSLHHIGPLAPAVEKAFALLKPTGLLLVEDFAFEEASREAVEWFADVCRSPSAQALLIPNPDALVTRLLDSSDPMATWRERHDHDVHTGAAMTQAISQRFVMRVSEPVPYLYRYLVSVLPETPDGARFIEYVMRHETHRWESHVTGLIGRRFVASPRR